MHLVHGRRQTLGEEIANAISHGAGALFAIVAIPVLVVAAVQDGRSASEILGFTLFGVSAAVLYLTSTLYHALPGRLRARVLPDDETTPEAGTPATPPHGMHPVRTVKRVFRVLDHAAIHLLIAGTYSPFALGVFRDEWGWTMFAMVWTFAIAGILLETVSRAPHPWVSTALYVAFGWLVMWNPDPLWTTLPRAGLAWLAAGGLAYTAGVVFFVLDDRVRYAHFAWHLFVLAGTVCHFVAVLGYA